MGPVLGVVWYEGMDPGFKRLLAVERRWSCNKAALAFPAPLAWSVHLKTRPSGQIEWMFCPLPLKEGMSERSPSRSFFLLFYTHFILVAVVTNDWLSQKAFILDLRTQEWFTSTGYLMTQKLLVLLCFMPLWRSLFKVVVNHAELVVLMLPQHRVYANYDYFPFLLQTATLKIHS